MTRPSQASTSSMARRFSTNKTTDNDIFNMKKTYIAPAIKAVRLLTAQLLSASNENPNSLTFSFSNDAIEEEGFAD